MSTTLNPRGSVAPATGVVVVEPVGMAGGAAVVVEGALVVGAVVVAVVSGVAAWCRPEDEQAAASSVTATGKMRTSLVVVTIACWTAVGHERFRKESVAHPRSGSDSPTVRFLGCSARLE
jgi:hypothetical protein